MKKTKNILLLLVVAVFALAGASFTASALDGILGKVYRVLPANEPYGIRLSWNSVDDAEGYNIYRRCGDEKARFLTRVEGVDNTEYFDGNVTSGKIYYYSVKAVNVSGEGELSDEKRRTFTASPRITEVSSKKGYLSVSWNKVSGADEYIVYRKTGNGDYVKMGTAGKDTPYFNDKKVKNNTVYTYAVVTHDGKNLSTMDEAGFSARYLVPPEKFALANSNNKIVFSWGKVSGAQKYAVYRKDTVNKKWIKLDTITKTKYADSTVENGKQYYYTVRAIGKNGVSAYVTSKKFTAVFNLTGVAVTNKPGAVRLTWKANPIATAYKVYREENGAWKAIGVVKNKTNFDDKNVANGKVYKYTVRAYCNSDKGGYNNDGYSAVYYSAPKLSLQYSPKGLKLNWTKAATGNAYTVYYKPEGQQKWTKLAVIKNIKTVTFTHKDAINGHKNTYMIRVNGTKTTTDSYTASLYGIDPTKKMVALTYDDGPYSVVTDRILKTLNKYNSRATFFIVGNRVNSYKSSLKKAVNIGCEIGNHTYSHTILTSVNAATIQSQISKTNAAVKEITGVTPKIARAPGGSVNATVRKNVKYPLIGWSVDTLDWKNRNAKSVVSKIKANVKDGSIVLMHDLYGTTADATEEIVPWLINNGYQIVTVTELMQLKGVDMKAGTVYYSAS